MPLLLFCAFVLIASVLFAQIAAGDVFARLLDEGDEPHAAPVDREPDPHSST